jgi:hypothetical protein
MPKPSEHSWRPALVAASRNSYASSIWTSFCFPTAADWFAGVARRPVVGADHVARLLLGVAAKHVATSWIGTVNGSPGVVFEADSGVVGVMAFTVAGGVIIEIDFVVRTAADQGGGSGI